MAHILDNAIWNAINTSNRDIAIIDDEVGCYHPDIAPFAGLKKMDNRNLEKLWEFIPAGRTIAIAYEEKIDLDEAKWRSVRKMDCYQMIYENPVSSFIAANTPLIVPLGLENIPQMIELTALTKPGPFYEKTILFGNYFGIFADGRLVAMTGQRMHPVPFMEVSAVCTHPDFRGMGHAKALMLYVMKIILDDLFTPFLHVLTNNTAAIQLYESIGFRIRKKLFIHMIRRL